MPEQAHPNKFEANINCPEISLKDWLKEGKEWAHNEYVRVIPDTDAFEIRLYRLTGEAGSGEFVQATVPVDRFRLIETDRRDHHDPGRTPKAFHLHASEAQTLIAWLDCLKWERSDPRIEVRWYGDNGMDMTEGRDLKEETLIFEFKNDDGRVKRQVAINGTWETETQMLAGF